jgi:hypothetical protein
MESLKTLVRFVRAAKSSFFLDDHGQSLHEMLAMLLLMGSLLHIIYRTDSKKEMAFKYTDVPAQFQSIVKSLASMPIGNVAFNPITRMKADEPYTINLDLSSVVSASELEKELRSQLNGQDVETHQIHVAPVMEATLRGETFKITPSDPQRQAVDPKKTEWLWQVTPTRGGKQILYLSLASVLSVDGKEYPHGYPPFAKTIKVDVNPSRMVGDFLHDHWDYSAASISGLGLLLYRLRQKRKQSQEDFGFAPHSDK